MIAPSPRELVRAVRDELATPGRYHLHTHVVTHRSWLQIIFAWIVDRYRAFEHALAAHVKIGPAGVSLFGDVLIAVMALTLAYVGARLLLSVQAERLARAQVLELDSSRSASAVARAAADAADAGEYARAIRLLFAAGVTLLDLRGAIDDDASATVNDLRRALATRESQTQEAFGILARAYTAAAYAEVPVSAQTWNDVHDAYTRLRETVRS